MSIRAVISVSDKTGLGPFARTLAEQGVDIYSTGGTKKAIAEAGAPVKSISELTGFPEILDGRVKTLHPAVHGGILARRDVPDHMSQLESHGIGLIDMVVVNLYPFVETASRDGVDLTEALENVDIGGPTLVRASAKNFPHVLVVVDPNDYDTVAQRLADGAIDQELRKSLARKAFRHVALYDTAIADYLSDGSDPFPDELTIGMTKAQGLRYGENPHQQGAFYAGSMSRGGGIAGANQLWGKELSFNNIADADAAWGAASDFEGPAVAIIKHMNPCGLAGHEDLTEAYEKALAGDPVSAFGGIVACNRKVNLATAEEISKVFYEIVIAPSFEEEALALLKRRKNLRMLEMGTGRSDGSSLDVKTVQGGYLVQIRDSGGDDPSTWRCVTKRVPTPDEMEDLAFAWKAAKHVKSNAIVLVKGKALVGMGAGQPNRVNSVHLALRAAEDRARGSVLASDAFFPFADNVQLAAGGGVVAAVQPGGSVRDQEVIDAADELGMAMVFTGVRHFRH